MMRILDQAKTLKVPPAMNKLTTMYGDFECDEGKVINYAGINAVYSAIY